MATKVLQCPSYGCKPAASLIGLITSAGAVAFLGKPLRIDADFVEMAHQGRAPDARFRFAGPCANGGCSHWKDAGCAIAARLPAATAASGQLPECGMREACRWHHDRGDGACAACQWVVRQVAVEK